MGTTASVLINVKIELKNAVQIIIDENSSDKIKEKSLHEVVLLSQERMQR